MRFLIVFLFILLGIWSCKVDTNDVANIEVKSYSYEDIEYPQSAVRIPDSIKVGFVENFFVPWETPPEELLASLDVFPGREISYLTGYLDDDSWYGENKKPHKTQQRQEIVTNAAVETFPNFQKRGIVVSLFMSLTTLKRSPKPISSPS